MVEAGGLLLGALCFFKVVRHTQASPAGVDWGWAAGKCQEG